MKIFVFAIAIAALLFSGMSYAKESPRKDNTFDVIVLDKTNNRVLHKERFTFGPIEDGSTRVKLIYQIGEFFGGLQFTLMAYPNGAYEALISPVPDGKIVTSESAFSKKVELSTEWNKVTYTFSVDPQ